MSPVKGVFLDADSLELETSSFNPIQAALDELVCYGTTSQAQLAERIADAEVVITNKVKLDRETIERAPALRCICVAATGINNVDVAAARERGIVVSNCRGYGTDSVAQHTMALMLALATNLQRYHADAMSGKWSRSHFFCRLDHPIIELAGKTLGIIGYGTLGQRVATLAQAFSMRVLIAQRPGSTEVTADRVALGELLPQVDVLSLHCPLTDQTRGLIDQDALAQMKPSAILINTARGGIVDEAALANALRRGQIGGAGIDVLPEEPPVHGSPLLAEDIPNLIVTPHCAWGSVEARLRTIDQIAENIVAFRRGEPCRLVT